MKANSKNKKDPMDQPIDLNRLSREQIASLFRLVRADFTPAQMNIWRWATRFDVQVAVLREVLISQGVEVVK